MERGYLEIMIQKQILRAQQDTRNDIPKREKRQMPEEKLTFNSTCSSALENVRWKNYKYC